MFSHKVSVYYKSGTSVITFSSIQKKGSNYIVAGRIDNNVLLLEITSAGAVVAGSAHSIKIIDLTIPPRAYLYDNTNSTNDGVFHAVKQYITISGGGAISTSLITLGSSYDNTYSNSLGDVFLMKTDINGVVSWCTSYPMRLSELRDAASNAMLVNSGTIYLVGEENASLEDDGIYQGVILTVPASTGLLSNSDCYDELSISRTSLDTLTVFPSLTTGTFNLTTDNVNDNSNISLTPYSYCFQSFKKNMSDSENQVPYLIYDINSINVYPNPFHDKLNVEITPSESGFSSDLYTFSMFNTFGQKIYSTQIFTPNQPININIANGIYLYKIFKNSSLIDSGIVSRN